MVILLTILSSACGYCQTTEDFKLSFGVDVMLGGRYDDIRMCVASPAGVKGGPIADVMLYTKLWFKDSFALGLNFPLMRPILFGAAFRMLQFEPEFTFDFKHTVNDAISFIGGFGIGASFHYGPDYKSALKDPGEPFAAAGPFLSGFMGMSFNGAKSRNNILGVRLFYVPLFSEAKGNGTVIGGALEYQADIFTVN
jgi:hypothetical protein